MTNSKDPKDIKIVFAPGAFDQFEGTQEELDEMVAEITAEFERMAIEGTLFEESQPVDEVDLEEMNEEEREAFLRFIAETEDMTDEEFSAHVRGESTPERKKRLN